MLPTWLSPVSFYGGLIRRCLSAAGLTSQTLDIDDETTLHFWGPSPNSSSPQKPALVLIHGFGPHGVWQWRPQISFFANDYNVFVPSLVFFGRSHSKSSDRSELFQAKCVGKLLEKLGVEKFSIVGTSYGGFVAYHMARMWPERVEKVVIASSAVNLKKQDNEGLIKRANAGRVEDVLLPATAEQLRTLMSLSSFRQPPAFTPNFIFNDFISVELVGGDNVKYGLPMAFTVTTLSWAAIAYKSELQAAEEVDNVRSAVKWGTQYFFLKASSIPSKSPICTGRKHENNIDQKTPGTEIAADQRLLLLPYIVESLNPPIIPTQQGQIDGLFTREEPKKEFIHGRVWKELKSPTQAHHTGSSVPVNVPKGSSELPLELCKQRNTPNPNELTGAIVGGPDKSDNFQDLRTKSSMTEPTTYIYQLPSCGCPC
nr:epoxide hydrolase 4-like [Ipomoea batatas]